MGKIILAGNKLFTYLIQQIDIASLFHDRHLGDKHTSMLPVYCETGKKTTYIKE